MRNRVGMVIRLFVMTVMALGLASLMASPASAQELVQCQTIIDGTINQDDCEVTVNDDGTCQVVFPNGQITQNVACSPEGCPQQAIDEDGNIYQFQCDGVVLPTVVPPTAVPPTETPVTPATETPVTPATETPVTPAATETPEVPETPEDLPDTGQGSASGQSNSVTILLLGAIGTVLALGAVAMGLRSNR